MSNTEQELISARATVVGMASVAMAKYETGGDAFRDYIERLQSAAHKAMQLMSERMDELNEQMRKP